MFCFRKYSSESIRSEHVERIIHSIADSNNYQVLTSPLRVPSHSLTPRSPAAGFCQRPCHSDAGVAEGVLLSGEQLSGGRS